MRVDRNLDQNTTSLSHSPKEKSKRSSSQPAVESLRVRPVEKDPFLPPPAPRAPRALVPQPKPLAQTQTTASTSTTEPTSSQSRKRKTLDPDLKDLPDKCRNILLHKKFSPKDLGTLSYGIQKGIPYACSFIERTTTPFKSLEYLLRRAAKNPQIYSQLHDLCERSFARAFLALQIIQTLVEKDILPNEKNLTPDQHRDLLSRIFLSGDADTIKAHPNYCKWFEKYQSDIEKIIKEAPDLFTLNFKFLIEMAILDAKGTTAWLFECIKKELQGKKSEASLLIYFNSKLTSETWVSSQLLVNLDSKDSKNHTIDYEYVLLCLALEQDKIAQEYCIKNFEKFFNSHLKFSFACKILNSPDFSKVIKTKIAQWFLATRHDEADFLFSIKGKEHYDAFLNALRLASLSTLPFLSSWSSQALFSQALKVENPLSLGFLSHAKNLIQEDSFYFDLDIFKKALKDDDWRKILSGLLPERIFLLLCTYAQQTIADCKEPLSAKNALFMAKFLLPDGEWCQNHKDKVGMLLQGILSDENIEDGLKRLQIFDLLQRNSSWVVSPEVEKRKIKLYQEIVFDTDASPKQRSLALKYLIEKDALPKGLTASGLAPLEKEFSDFKPIEFIKLSLAIKPKSYPQPVGEHFNWEAKLDEKHPLSKHLLGIKGELLRQSAATLLPTLEVDRTQHIFHLFIADALKIPRPKLTEALGTSIYEILKEKPSEYISQNFLRWNQDFNTSFLTMPLVGWTRTLLIQLDVRNEGLLGLFNTSNLIVKESFK